MRCLGLTLVLFSACSTTSPLRPASDAASDATAEVASMSIGAKGGIVVSTDGRVTVTVPSGALDRDVTLTVVPIAAPVPGAIGQTYQIGPSETLLAAPATLVFKYDENAIGGNWPADLLIGTVVNGAWRSGVVPSFVEFGWRRIGNYATFSVASTTAGLSFAS